MKKKKGKHFKVKIINKTKFIKSLIITILSIISVIVLLVLNLTKNNEKDTIEETQGEVVTIETENVENKSETTETENAENKSEANETENVDKKDTTDSNNIEESQNENITTNNETSDVVEIKTDETIDKEIETLIQTIITQKGLNENNFGFFYYNINQNTEYKYNENKYFQGASTIKVPVSMVYYDMISEGTITKESKLKYTEDSYEEGDGTTAATYEIGSTVPLGFLIEQAIVNSDNTAVNIMIENLGYSQCKKEIQKYSDEEMPSEYYSSNIITPEFEFDIITYLYNNSSNYTELLEYMKKSSNGGYLKEQLPEYEIAHKYGSYDGNVHDYGIIYGKETYIVGIYTDGIANADDLIATIAKQIVDAKES